MKGTCDVEYTKLADDEFEPVVMVNKKRVVTTTKKHLERPRWLRLCLYATLALTGLFLTTCLAVGTFGYFWMKKQVIRFTVTKRVEYPVVNVPTEELDVAKDRAVLFVDTLRAGGVPDDLTITARELNGLIAASDYLRGNAFVTMTDEDKVSLDMSLPAKYLPGGKGRFFVASSYVDIAPEKGLVTAMFDTQEPVEGLDDDLFFAEFLVSQDQETDQVSVFLKSGEILGITLDSIVEEHENFIDYITDYEVKKVVEGIASVTFHDGKVVIKARKTTNDE